MRWPRWVWLVRLSCGVWFHHTGQAGVPFPPGTRISGERVWVEAHAVPKEQR